MKTDQSNGDNRWTQLGALRLRLLQKIQTSARADDMTTLMATTDRLRSGDALLDRVVALWTEENVQQSPPSNTESTISDYPSAKERGEAIRSAWVRSRLGNSVKNIRGALYRNARGETIGIAYGRRGDRGWFLGLPANKFDSAILLCESKDNSQISAVCIPVSLIQKYDSNLSENGGQKKFSILQRPAEWKWSVPRIGEIDVTANINNVSLVA